MRRRGRRRREGEERKEEEERGRGEEEGGERERKSMRGNEGEAMPQNNYRHIAAINQVVVASNANNHTISPCVFLYLGLQNIK